MEHKNPQIQAMWTRACATITNLATQMPRDLVLSLALALTVIADPPLFEPGPLPQEPPKKKRNPRLTQALLPDTSSPPEPSSPDLEPGER